MNAKIEALTGGFAEPVHHAQSVFRMMMDCLSRPGTIKSILPEVEPPKPMGIAAGAIALTLLDHDTPVWLTQGLAKSTAAEWISFHTGAPLTREKSEARFAFAEAGASLSSFGLFATGTQEYPDRSTTIVLEVTSLENGAPLRLTGPGIRDSTAVSPQGLPEMFLRQWADNRTLFPRGIDVVLTAGHQMLGLPRTCKITPKEV
ncbi:MULTISPECIES: phosphonate C-P lyase system protein PhnH [Alphaproteobacteria]|uniref:Alpha-D-ribose 1-methylphosphonate 5-triphosphate synthase subunit PhnH n=2 Tax=Alphaproteobacteria TaxID=28211 RepID=A0A512HIX8_9HYPH|nr:MULTISPECIES: phosphonate C-P lyase system protein PhnH [Alphaproteobacteria]GEO85387.1 alpha-D-ribose 1-methylphosphonate 5-triphosphate synthase subunit PhnH [Ciceribacter naphthalenivorans]GLR21026.1 alpha-D-ribose 1-methylphosphonate 5-triphosphate synthase subunit PhnH [Ciceribacter naphthalenivorans]GLT03882.1 alpha-D-ribose 1-methylphosphonate 5-triphosphate synthase subunit PhnH [Sphingomonas psychrolutea]